MYCTLGNIFSSELGKNSLFAIWKVPIIGLYYRKKGPVATVSYLLSEVNWTFAYKQMKAYICSNANMG